MKKRKWLLLTFMATVVIFCPYSILAQTWLGTISNDWNTAGNWSTNAVPTSMQTATFNAGAADCTIGADVSVGGINITNGYTGTVSLADAVTLTIGSGNFTQTGATFNCGNGAFVCGNNTTFNEDGGSFISSSNTIMLGGDVDFYSLGFNANGGTIILNSSGSANITVDGNNNAGVMLNNVVINMPTPNQPTNNYLLGSGSSLLIQGDLTITRGCFNGTEPGHVQLMGNFSMAQTGTAGNLTSNVNLEFTGSANTSLTLAAGGETLYNGGITLNKTSPDNTVTLNSPLTMNNQTNNELNFISGKLVTTATNLLTIAINGITITGGSDNSFVDGPMVKTNERGTANAGFVFPIGDNGRYAPIAISGDDNSITNFGGSSNHSFQAAYFRADPNTNFSVDSKDATLTNIGRCEYWVLDRLADPDGNADPFVWLSYDNSRSCGISTPAELRVAKWNGTIWNDLGNFQTTIGTTNYISTAAIVSTFSPFDLASTNAINNPLPITLVGFSGHFQEGLVHLQWTTTQESNSDHFTVERSADGDRFDSIATIAAAGNSSSVLHYKYDDPASPAARSYYRLKMTDKDSRFVYSPVISIETFSSGSAISVFPNPLKTGGKISLQVPPFRSRMVKVGITDMNGRQVSLTNLWLDGAGRGEVPLDNYLLSGIYVIQVSSEGGQYQAKVSVY